ncbi:hypothetical protein ES332_A06G249900v1 [Gossypium tomentosum]|uniref:Uncharacterized protein n=1 Tax=Gossypium tomentosum TaxID=34277 RepID=A0A5D2QBL0_GOSTO|nr:hypothetical protein ES332_A06G249900v1 [Gossypium tomentosum]
MYPSRFGLHEVLCRVSKHFSTSASSNEVREALKDEHLQKLISDIDSSLDALNELDKYMGLDFFRIFSDKILSVVNQ